MRVDSNGFFKKILAWMMQKLLPEEAVLERHLGYAMFAVVFAVLGGLFTGGVLFFCLYLAYIFLLKIGVTKIAASILLIFCVLLLILLFFFLTKFYLNKTSKLKNIILTPNSQIKSSVFTIEDTVTILEAFLRGLTLKKEAIMYKSLDDLPKQVKDLPNHAQEIYQKSFNNACEQYKEAKDRRDDSSREETAHKVAWDAVKQEYQKEGDKWVRK